MSALKIAISRRDESDVVVLRGNVLAGARAQLEAATAKLGKRCLFDWSGITITSSDGIREWAGFLGAFTRSRDVALAACPPSVMIFFNMFPACIEGARVVSAYGTFVCTVCKIERQELLRVGTDVSTSGDILTTYFCTQCERELALNLPEAEYFGFLSP